MSHLDKSTHGTRASAWTLGIAAGLLGLVTAGMTVAGCASSKPVAHVTEVPIDQYQPPPDPGAPAAVPTAAVEVVAEPPAEEPEVSKGGGHPQEIRGSASGTDKANQNDCRKLMDRYAILTGVAAGMSMSTATKKFNDLMQKVRMDKKMDKFVRTCSEKNTKDQVHCGIKATTMPAFQACIQ